MKGSETAGDGAGRRNKRLMLLLLAILVLLQVRRLRYLLVPLLLAALRRATNARLWLQLRRLSAQHRDVCSGEPCSCERIRLRDATP